MGRKILCLDFDGVIHSYTSGWLGVEVIPDPPVPGAIEFIIKAMSIFNVVIVSSRFTSTLHRILAFRAVSKWLIENGIDVQIYYDVEWDHFRHNQIHQINSLTLCATKPPASVTLDDRALTFDGSFPDPSLLLEFQPWHHKAT